MHSIRRLSINVGEHNKKIRLMLKTSVKVVCEGAMEEVCTVAT